MRGVPKLERNAWKFYVYHGLTMSESETKTESYQPNFWKNFYHYDNNNFFGFHPKQAFLPPTNYKFG